MSGRSSKSESPSSPSTPKARATAYGSGVPQIRIDSPSRTRSSRVSESSGSETEMSERKQEKHRESSKGSSSKSSSKSGSKSSSSKSKSSSSKDQKDDWSDVVEPDERRRIQNRIAQRKFREKVRDQKEAQERDAINQQRAGYSYSTPEPGEMSSEYELSGLPWGGIDLKHVFEKGQARERGSQQASQEQNYYDYGTGSNSGRGSESR